MRENTIAVNGFRDQISLRDAGFNVKVQFIITNYMLKLNISAYNADAFCISFAYNNTSRLIKLYSRFGAAIPRDAPLSPLYTHRLVVTQMA